MQLATSVNTGYQITIDPSSVSTVYRSTVASIIPHMVYAGFDRSADGGQTWTSIDNGIAGNVVTAFIIDPHNPAILYLANVWEGIGVPPPPPGFFKSIDAGSTWAPLTPMLGAISGLAIDPTAGILYASASTGVYRSTDNGASFSQISSTVLYKLVLDAAHPKPTVRHPTRVPGRRDQYGWRIYVDELEQRVVRKLSRRELTRDRFHRSLPPHHDGSVGRV